MKNGSFIVMGCFVIGCLVGYADLIPTKWYSGDVALVLLYLLMLQVGLSIGLDKNLRQIVTRIRLKFLLVPLATISGTLLFSALLGLCLSGFSFADYMAVGSGFAYYSLSSILITQLKTPSLGFLLASELGTIALMANIFREILTLFGAPFLARYFGKLAPICAGGATTMDVTLPVITQVCGKEWTVMAIFHGILMDFSVPFFVSFFCSL